jgi:hypothetical protein
MIMAYRHDDDEPALVLLLIHGLSKPIALVKAPEASGMNSTLLWSPVLLASRAHARRAKASFIEIPDFVVETK